MADRLQWQREGRDWPHREASRFVDAGGLRWHVQVMPARQAATKSPPPVLLLVHGTGASTHSWRSALPLLSRSFTVVAPDLPGHGFSGTPPPQGYALPAMAAALRELLEKLQVTPAIAVGHSAGAAILAWMCLEKMIAPQHLVSLNGALLPLSGLPGEVFSPLARLLSGSRVIPRLFAWRAADPAVRERLLRGTGSTIDGEGSALYGTLMSNAQHAAAALAMMAQWDLRPLQRELPGFSKLPCALTLVVGDNDRTVSPGESRRVQAMLPGARLISVGRLGHLAHEERPAEVCDLIERLAA